MRVCIAEKPSVAGGASVLNDAVQSQEFQDALQQGLENVQELEKLNEGK
ncbi:hypothetical protein N9Q76_03480 [Flavobacteriales bacterium]|nr:hypothetical protein [Flavobacteriales bacterium]